MKRNNIITDNVINSVIEEFPLLDKLYRKYNLQYNLHIDIFISICLLQYTVQSQNSYKVTERLEYYK